MFKNRMLRLSVAHLLIMALIFVTGCAGTAPNPVDRHQPNDGSMSCTALAAEYNSIDDEVELRRESKKKRDVLNVVCFITGLFIIVPFFFMDVKLSQEAEIRAYKERQDQLHILADEKNCDMSHTMSEPEE